MSENNNKIGFKGYWLPFAVVFLSIATVYTVVVLIPDMVMVKNKAGKYAVEYVERDAEGKIVFDKDGKPVKNQAGRGREVYVREGCTYCHSMFVRPQDRDFGSKVHASDYANETPHILGTSRTGPDLSNEGGKLPDQWHKAHLRDPRAYTPGSIMPSFSYLNDQDLDDLVAFIQTLGIKRFEDPANRHIYEAYYPEADDAFWKASEHHKPNPDSAAAANAGAGIFRQNCAVCHGLNGLGNGPNALAMAKKPANFSRPFYKKYSDYTWYWRVAEGVPGTRMPRWKLKLEPEQMWYLVAYLKTLPQDTPIIRPYEKIDDTNWNKQSALNNRVIKRYKQIENEKLTGHYDTRTPAMEGSHGGGH